MNILLLQNKLIYSNIDIRITKVITDISNLNYNTAKYLASQGIDIYNINDDFFNNFCNGIISVNNQDLTLDNKIEDIYVNISFCDNDCEYQGINLETNKVNVLILLFKLMKKIIIILILLKIKINL